jgi:hypothetical protein
MLRPEEGRRRVAFIPPKHVGRCGLALPLGYGSVLDPHRSARASVRPTGEVACRENIGVTGLQTRIDEDAAIDLKPRRLSEAKPRSTPTPRMIKSASISPPFSSMRQLPSTASTLEPR